MKLKYGEIHSFLTNGSQPAFVIQNTHFNSKSNVLYKLLIVQPLTVSLDQSTRIFFNTLSKCGQVFVNTISYISPTYRFYKTKLKSRFFAKSGSCAINKIKLKIGVKSLSSCTVIVRLKRYLVELVLVLLSII